MMFQHVLGGMVGIAALRGLWALYFWSTRRFDVYVQRSAPRVYPTLRYWGGSSVFLFFVAFVALGTAAVAHAMPHCHDSVARICP